MSVIPLHLQRKFEKWWAARLLSLATSAVFKSSQLKGALSTSPGPARANGKLVQFSKPAQNGL